MSHSKISGDAVWISPTLNVSTMLFKVLSEGPDGMADIYLATWTGEALHYVIGGAIVEVLQRISDSFGAKLFLAMFYKLACLT